MTHFDKDFILYFKELEKNNNKEWFHENIKRYENSVKKPFRVFLDSLIMQLHELDKRYTAEAKDCVGRINRDVRFSKDKTPYTTYYTGFVTPKGKKDKGSGGIYLRFSHQGLWVMTGLYGMEKEQLHALRQAIASAPKKFHRLIENNDFHNVFGELKGEKNKRLPTKELMSAAKKEPLIFNNQFYFISENGPDMIIREDLIDVLVEMWKVAKPVNEYLVKGIGYG